MPTENYRVVLVVNESSSRVSTTLYPVHRTMSICDVFDLSEVKDMLQDKMKDYSKDIDVTTDDKNMRYRGLVEDAKRQTTAGRVDKDKRQRYLAEKGVIVLNEGILWPTTQGTSGQRTRTARSWKQENCLQILTRKRTTGNPQRL